MGCSVPMATHRIEPDERTLHGVFSRDLPPVLSVDSGDTVVLRTLDAGWHLEPPLSSDVPAREWFKGSAGNRLFLSRDIVSYIHECLPWPKSSRSRSSC